jgi:hypothetical protein
MPDSGKPYPGAILPGPRIIAIDSPAELRTIERISSGVLHVTSLV